MERSLRRLFVIWLATSVAAAGGALLAYRMLVQVPELAGRTDPGAVLERPETLFEDPGLLGTAVEIRVTRAVDACMAARGFDYRGPAAIEGLGETLDPARHGYGIATGPVGGEVLLGAGGAEGAERDAYEQALYGSGLPGAAGSGGCAAVGLAEFQQALATLESLPYSLDRLEADTRNHPAMAAALQDWAACMAGRGYTASSPDQLIAGFVERLSQATPQEGRVLAEEERRTAVDDFACRAATIDPATQVVAAELGPAFVAANRPQLEALMPPEPASPGDFTIPTDLGSGDVQVTLLWTAPVDLDLEVTDPLGATIDYGRTTSPSGGRLDRDANRGCRDIVPDPVENVFWADGTAPAGTYRVEVNLFSRCSTTGPVDFTLIVQVDGRVVVNERRTLESGSWSTEFGYG